MKAPDSIHRTRLEVLQMTREAMRASLARAAVRWQTSAEGQQFALARFERLLGDEALLALLTEADQAGRHHCSVLAEHLMSEAICMWVLIGLGIESPAAMRAIVHGAAPVRPLH